MVWKCVKHKMKENLVVIKTLNNKCMTSVSKNMYIDKLADIVIKYNNTYYSITKIKPVDVKSTT